MNTNKLNFRKISGIAIIAGMFLLSSCETDFGFNNENEVVTPNNFTFATTNNVKLNVAVSDTYNNQYYYKIEVFDRNPAATDTLASLLTAGVAKGNAPMQTELIIPTRLSRVFVRQTDPLQRTTVRVMNVNAETTELSLSFAGIVSTSSSAAKAPRKVLAVDPHATDYELPETYITLKSSEETLSAQKYYVPAGVSNKKINFGWLENSELYVAGRVTFDETFYMPANCKLVVLPGGSVTFNVGAAFEQKGVVVAVHPEAVLTFNQISGAGNGTSLINDGTINLKAEFEIRLNSNTVNNGTINGSKLTMTNNSTFKNNGFVNLSNVFNMNTNTLFNNDGVLVADSKIVTNNTTSVINNFNTLRTGYFDMNNGGASLNNYCKIISNDFGVNGSTINSYAGSVIACENFDSNLTTLNLYGDAILKTNVAYEDASSTIAQGVTFNYGVVLNGIAEGSDKPVVIIGQLNNNQGWQVVSLEGNMEFALPASQTAGANFYKSISKGISFVEVPTVTIEATDCNGGGVNADSGSGAPSNPEFPMEVKEDNQYTFILEDLWPAQGDYDLNDLVFEVRNIKKMINKNNEVVSLSFDIKPIANGSTMNIAVALQFDNIPAGEISLTSTSSIGSIEEGQAQASILLFPNAHTLFGNDKPVVTNTFSHVKLVETKEFSYTVEFKSPVANADAIMSSMNFYTIVGDPESADRKEVHLAGFKPSKKVKSETNNYKDNNNMVWAIMLPVTNFAYPTEGTKIYDAYPSFHSWTGSNGKAQADWYLHPSKKAGLTFKK